MYTRICKSCCATVVSGTQSDALFACRDCDRWASILPFTSATYDECKYVMWSVFNQCEIIQNATVGAENGNEPVYDYYIPEYGMVMDVMPLGGYQQNADIQAHIELKDRVAYANNLRYYSLSRHADTLRSELVKIVNEFYVLYKQDTYPQLLSPRLPGDAGWDIICSQTVVCAPRSATDIPSDLYLEIPNQLYAIVQARSSTSKKRLLVLPGVLDPAYRGQIFTMTFNLTDDPITITKGDKISQILFFHRIPHIHSEMVTALRPSLRGDKGFGSTDVNK
jgi:dUTP pyrophosphatase